MQQMRQQQIKGQLGGESLADDIKFLNDNNKYFNEPVEKVSELPLEGNDDGDIRVVKSENKAYIWDEETSEWVCSKDIYTKTVYKDIVLGVDNQTTIHTKIPVGVVGGMVSLDTVRLEVNGMGQKADKDYIVQIDTDFSCMLEWKSRDFQLEISDTITMSYDIIQLS